MAMQYWKPGMTTVLASDVFGRTYEGRFDPTEADPTVVVEWPGGNCLTVLNAFLAKGFRKCQLINTSTNDATCTVGVDAQGRYAVPESLNSSDLFRDHRMEIPRISDPFRFTTQDRKPAMKHQVSTEKFRQDPAAILEEVGIRGTAVEICHVGPPGSPSKHAKPIAVMLRVDEYEKLTRLRDRVASAMADTK